ncbi:Flp pilus assembly protein CpaB [Spirillospora albida]|uniref:Flp pilus assembly protein CpaB n=1 Tax=Spirillospora albida TaxID=58123 RepID=UPI0004C1072E|nr:Flp pilus assembly protein CpaB [Spirillospora albida]
MTVRSARFRRLLAAVLAATATALSLHALRPAQAPSVRVLAAARDLPAGARLTETDLRSSRLPPEAVPSGALRSGATGRVLAGPVRRGEPLTDARLLDGTLARDHPPGTVAAPIRIADAATVRLVRPGTRIDVLAATPDAPSGAPEARTIATDIPVMAVPPRGEGEAQEGALLLVAATRPQARALAAAGPALSLTITPH